VGIAQDYSTASTFKWSANGVGGTYGVEVDVRDVSRPLTYDGVANITYVLNACSGASLTTDLASPQPTGASVTLTGGATCPRSHEFRFWSSHPGELDFGPVVQQLQHLCVASAEHARCLRVGA